MERKKQDEYLFRKMREEDLDAVCRIEKETFSMPWTRESLFDSMKQEENVYLVAEYKGNVIGYCGMWGIAGEGQINNVAVDKNYRGRGVATEMMKAFLAEGKKKNLTEFTLEVRESNYPAIQLYEHIGFQNAGIRKNFYEAPTENAIIMWLKE